ncbi:ribonuclease III [Periconia macrospinosa]|uniref:Ribonuclease III n=1 Tax=Periconia macrospinosa TaxID=97972 RepID=A0A2V1DXN1_9PLEO|nr:ribonuclease III [Periconia macrospinosa]
MENRITKVSDIFGYVFDDKMRCIEALQMDGQPLYLDGSWVNVPKNNRLAVLGDAILDATLCKLWYRASDAYGPRPARDWSSARNEVLGNGALYVRGESLGLGPLILVNLGHGNGPVSPKMMATTFEAMFGAIYMDGGEEAVLKTVKYLGLDNHPSLMVT